MKSTATIVAWMLCLACILAPQQSTAQNENVKCGTMEYLEKQKKADPTLEERMQVTEEQLETVIETMKRQKTSSLGKGKPGTQPPPTFQNITIPVVVHIIYNPAITYSYPTITSQYISQQDVIDQIAITNRDYAGNNPHLMGSFPSTLKANTQIQFCLAQRDPNGWPTNGIEWRETSLTDFPVDNSMKFYSSGGLDAWDPTRYFNIWVCDIQTYAGYAQFPTSGLTSTYGVVVDFACFGDRDETIVYRGGGACLTHEIGHCLNLRHIWGDDNGACSGTDYCDDTPNQANSTINAALYDPTVELLDACSPSSPGINFQNFMDYSRDIVMSNFTPDQKIRMQACFAAGGPLVPLLSSNAGTPLSACEIPIGLGTTTLSKSTATLAWLPTYQNNGSYNVRYKKTSASAWTLTSTNTNSKLITGLTKSTNYEFQVENVCVGGTSGYSTSYFFRTPANVAPKDARTDEPTAPSVLTISPNPVLGQSTISYTLNEAGAASVTILNVLGAEVARLGSAQRQDAGTYTLQYDASRLIPGLYFVRLAAGRTIETTKFVIQR